MRARLAYGKSGLIIDLDPSWDVQILEPRFVPGLPDPLASLQEALRNPIGSPSLVDLIRSDDRVGIICNDLTRPTPNPLLLSAIFRELELIPNENITIFIALGTRRSYTEAELGEMLGDTVFERYRIVQNNAFDRGTQVCTGVTRRGNEI